MRLAVPVTTVSKYDVPTETGVDSYVAVKFVWDDENVGHVLLTPSQAKCLAALLVSAGYLIDPETDRP